MLCLISQNSKQGVKWPPGRSQDTWLVTSIRSDHKNKTWSGIIPQWVCHLLPQENHPNSCQHAQNVKRSWECFIYPSTSVFFISLLRRDCLSFSLATSASWACCLVVGSGKHQPVTMGLSVVHLEFAQTAAQGGGEWLMWAMAMVNMDNSLEKICAVQSFSIYCSWLCLFINYISAEVVLLEKKKAEVLFPGMGSELEAGRDETSQPQEAAWDVKGNCNAYNPTYFSLFYFKTLNSFVGSLHLGNSVQWNSSWMLETRKNSLIVEMALPSWKQWEESTQGVSLTEGQARYLSCQALTTCCF